MVKRLNSLPDQLELAQFVLELVLVLLSDLARAALADAERFARSDSATGAFRRVEASMIVTRVDLMRLRDHVVVKLVTLINFVEAQIRDFLDSFEVKVALNHRWLRHK